MERRPVLLENDILVFRALLAYWPHGCDRTKLSDEVELKRSTVYDALVRLKTRGLVLSSPCPKEDRGRPTVVFWVDPPTITREMWERIETLRPSNQEVVV